MYYTLLTIICMFLNLMCKVCTNELYLMGKYLLFCQEWEDEFLIWNPAEFANISTLRVPCNKLWLPDIVLYNK